MKALEVSILIPIYNEAEILAGAVSDLLSGLDALHINYELVLCENGSKDGTKEIAALLDLSRKTIETYREHIKAKLKLRNGSELTRQAMQWVYERSTSEPPAGVDAS